jgi:hypothetical protein
MRACGGLASCKSARYIGGDDTRHTSTKTLAIDRGALPSRVLRKPCDRGWLAKGYDAILTMHITEDKPAALATADQSTKRD